jgi:hypothetical protein
MPTLDMRRTVGDVSDATWTHEKMQRENSKHTLVTCALLRAFPFPRLQKNKNENIFQPTRQHFHFFLWKNFGFKYRRKRSNVWQKNQK